MSDWHEMEAGDALNRFLAERAGYRVEFALSTFVTDRDRNLWVATLLDQDGMFEMSAWHLAEGDIEGAWRQFLSPDPECGAIGPPFFSENLHAALKLPIPELAEFEIHISPFAGGARARVFDFGGDIPVEAAPPFEVADTPALAVCRAWLAFQDGIGS